MRRAVLSLVGVVLAMSISSYVSAAGASTPPSSAAVAECARVTEGSSAKDEEACAQGYGAAKAGKAEAQDCDPVGSEAVTDTEDVKDCLDGWVLVDVAGTGEAAKPNAAAVSECARVSEGSSAKDEEACAQGFDGAKAGKTVEQSCYSVGSGAVTDTEDVKDCLDGWVLADVAGTGEAAKPSAAAVSECSRATEGSTAKDEESCAQGFDGAKAGKTVEQSCDSLGSGAVTDTEDVKDCEVGWSLG